MAEPGPVVQVLYALPDEQIVVDVCFEAGMTAVAAVERSGLLSRYPEIGECELVLGVWGVDVALDCRLRPGDRVEISRPLVADPRDMRRELLSGGRVMGGASAPGAALNKKGRA